MSRQANCPNCGGPIEFKLGSSAAMICPYCRHSVMRTDRDLQSLGKVADLVPTAPEMVVGDMGTVNGEEFVAGGRLQLDHGRGPWDEWYVELTRSRRWAWLAKAQGRWYLTFPVEASGLPGWEQLEVGRQGQLPGVDTPLTVSERGGSALLSAEGELPFAAVPGDSGRYTDLVGPQGRFATIDYGDGTSPPQLYAGNELDHGALTFTKSALGPRPVEKVQAERLRCPTCGAPVPILAPEITERTSCESCFSLLDYSSGKLAFLKQLEQERSEPMVPLGSVGTLYGLEHTVIGMLERSTSDRLLEMAANLPPDATAWLTENNDAALDEVPGTYGTYTWREYLLHTEQGYRWLLEDGRHFTYIEPISAGDVTHAGNAPSYRGASYKPFNKAIAVVTYVVGEFYWKVERGEAVRAQDYIAPPTMLSMELSSSEVHWSYGRYTPIEEIWSAFDLPGRPPPQNGVAPAQPNPRNLRFAAGAAAVFIALLGILFVVMSASGPSPQKLVDHAMTMPLAPDSEMAKKGGATAAGGVSLDELALSTNPSFTKPFDVPSDARALDVTLNATLRDEWIGVAVALIDQKTGKATEWSMEIDAFASGIATYPVAKSKQETLAPVTPGRYVMRLDPRWVARGKEERAAPTASLSVAVAAGDPGNICCCGGSAILLLLPLFWAWMRRRQFESQRWENSNL